LGIYIIGDKLSFWDRLTYMEPVQTIDDKSYYQVIGNKDKDKGMYNIINDKVDIDFQLDTGSSIIKSETISLKPTDTMEDLVFKLKNLWGLNFTYSLSDDNNDPITTIDRVLDKRSPWSHINVRAIQIPREVPPLPQHLDTMGMDWAGQSGKSGGRKSSYSRRRLSAKKRGTRRKQSRRQRRGSRRWH
jgi:hypothetical protein